MDFSTKMYESPLPPGKTAKKKQKKSGIGFKIFIIFCGLIVVSLLGIFGGGLYFVWLYSKDLPNYDALANYAPPVMTRIHANDGSLIAEYAREKRIYVPINAIPKRVLHAFLSAEDKTFFEHSGIDPYGIARAIANNIKGALGGGDRRAQGASTITQQVAKNFLLTNERSMERKVKEAILAIRIERAFTKEQILELYLNHIFLGVQSYGVAAAGLNYFGKSLEELSVAEVAYLAALPKGPNNYHPYKHRVKAVARRNWVIEQMRLNGYISDEEAKVAKATPLRVSLRQFGAHIFAAEFFAEEVRRQLQELYGEEKLYGGGLSVRTTLDPKLQKIAKMVLVDGLVRYDRAFGWRGAVKKVQLQEDWGESFEKVPVLSDIDPWHQAVVLEVTPQEAKIGLRPDMLQSGKMDRKRITGRIPLAEVEWAKPFKDYKNFAPDKNEKSAPKVKSVSDVLSRGDIVYVLPRFERLSAPEEKGKEKEAVNLGSLPENAKIIDGEWRLMQIPQIDGAIVAMDPHTGRVHAMVGGFSFAANQFNRSMQARRQPGSVFKPIVYATALDNGYNPASVVLDGPLVIDQGPGKEPWKPKNYDDKFYGPSTLRGGIEKSRNLMTVRLAQDVGMPIISEYSKRFGIYDSLPPVLSMSLGAGETTLMRVTTGYGMFVNGGRQIRATLIDRIQDRYGRTVMRHDLRACPECTAKEWSGQDEPALVDERQQIIDPQTAYQMTTMMEGVIQRGTGTSIKAVAKPLAGKTGTTNDQRDAWFVGFSPDLAVGIFVGFDNPQPMGKGATGGGVAAPMFRDFMKVALADKAAIPFRIPSGMKLIRINSHTGAKAMPDDKEAILEAFKPDQDPPEASSNMMGQGEQGGFNQSGFASQSNEQPHDWESGGSGSSGPPSDGGFNGGSGGNPWGQRPQGGGGGGGSYGQPDGQPQPGGLY